MSIRSMLAVWDQSQHKGVRLSLLLALADWANDVGLSWYGYDNLAQRGRISKRQAMRLVGDIADSGELWVFNRPQNSNVYVVVPGLTLEELWAARKKAVELGATSTRGADTLDMPQEVLAFVKSRGDKNVTLEAQGDKAMTPQGDKAMTPQGDKAMTPDPSLSPNEPSFIPSGPDGPLVPTSLEGWLKQVETPPKGSNRTAQLVAMFEALFPGKDLPEFSYMGAVAKRVGGGGRMAQLLWQTAGARITGDPMRYAQGIYKGSGARSGQTKKTRAKQPETKEDRKEREELRAEIARVRQRQQEEAGNG